MQYMVSRIPSPRPNLLRCGSSSRDVAAFIPPYSNLQVVAGCVPDQNTQAVLVTRSGTPDPGLGDWVEAGGVLITEYSQTEEVYETVFGGDVALGARLGSCYDNVEPVVQHGPGNPFWSQNDFVGVADNRSGCGYDMASYPRITWLGGWSEATVSLAYRDRGRGRVYLVEADWQDANANWVEESTTLMQSMVGWRPQALRPYLMLCGSSGRDVAAFIPPGSGLIPVAGCEPDPWTQALLVTRTGEIDPNVLKDYLAAGGKVIGEYSNSDELYLAAFDLAVSVGSRTGSCRDGIQSAVQFNEDDAVWARVPEFVPDPEQGCGYDMSGYPDITWVGGWDGDSVSLAYRDLGHGRLWLVEADWQDNEVPLSAASIDLMNAMILMPGWP